MEYGTIKFDSKNVSTVKLYTRLIKPKAILILFRGRVSVGAMGAAAPTVVFERLCFTHKTPFKHKYSF